MRRGEELCESCAEARTIYHREYYRAMTRIKRPEVHHVDATPTREAILTAIERGVSIAQISRATGHSENGIRRIKDGSVQHTKRITRDRLIKACEEAEPIFRDGYFPVEITSLRLRSLKDMGATHRWLAQQLKTSESQIDRVVRRKSHQVSEDFAKRVEDLVLAVGRGDTRSSSMVPRSNPCPVEGCNRYVDGEGVCVRCRKRASRKKREEAA